MDYFNSQDSSIKTFDFQSFHEYSDENNIAFRELKKRDQLTYNTVILYEAQSVIKEFAKKDTLGSLEKPQAVDS